MRVAYLITSGVALFESFWQQVDGIIKNGGYVDVIISNSGGMSMDMLPSNNHNLSIRFIYKENEKNHFAKYLCRVFQKLFFKFFVHSIKDSDQYLKDNFLNNEMLECMLKDYDYIIACDEISLFWAFFLLKSHTEKIIYHSYELYWEKYLYHSKIQDVKNYILYRRCTDIMKELQMIIIQDEERWNSLCKYTGVDKYARHFLWPITEKGRPCEIVNQADANLVSHEVSVLYLTAILRKRKVLDLCKAFSKVSCGTLCIHGGIGENYTKHKLEKLSRLCDNVDYSKDFLSHDELVRLVDHSSIVFLYYDESDDNNTYICHASNKLALALERGKPLIVMGNSNLTKLCRENECGVSIRTLSPQMIERAIHTIMENYDYYCKNSRKLFLQEYDSILYIDSFYHELEKTVS